MERHSRTLLKFLFCGCITILMNGDGIHTWFHSFSPFHGFAFPHCSFLCLTQDLEGFIYCFLQPHPVFLATNWRLISRQKWGVQTATPALHVAFQQVQMLMLAHIISRCVSRPQLCVGHEPVSPNNLLTLLCSTFSLGCSSGKLQGYSCWNSIPHQPPVSFPYQCCRLMAPSLWIPQPSAWRDSSYGTWAAGFLGLGTEKCIPH